MAKTGDKREYESILEACASRTTIGSFQNKFAKVWAKTEDPALKKYLGEIIRHFRLADRHLGGSKNGSKTLNQKTSLPLEQEPYRGLFEYCKKCLESEKPQWKIIAEQKGWGPKE